MICTSTGNKSTKKLSFVLKIFVAADKLNAFKILNKVTINPKPITVLCFDVSFEQF